MNLQSSLLGKIPGVQLQSTLRKKIKIARWLTNKIAEYDVTNDFWINQATDVKAPFSAFSAAVYLPG